MSVRGIPRPDFLRLCSEIGTLSSEWNTFVHKICEVLLNSIKCIKFLLPSKLLSDLTDCAERLLSDRDMHMHYVEMLRFCPESSGNIKSQFLLEFVLCFVTEMLCFISNRMSTCDQTKNDDRIQP